MPISLYNMVVYYRDTDARSQMAICSTCQADLSDQLKKQTSDSQAEALEKELRMAEEYKAYLSDLKNHPQYSNDLEGQNISVLATCIVSRNKLDKLEIRAIGC